ncbi:hypothetical protein [Phytohabitans aurantiacus]|jgi:hypothetical protein|uniref:Uncharacterized protein n=1 Tax=Phytohabitans aurantiacus TaxID=3016789 RepID=A0ABQ5RB06_9ACTN|nr:hypothetical protein [Phytohabitans aurantiacus]GLI03914.1 hypothetical protein Pa4123_91950 [Phytohabitans aurantiacus]
MTFNFGGGQQAGNITNVGGDMTVHGNVMGQYNAGLQEIEALRAALARVPLAPAQRAEAESLAGEAAASMGDSAKAAGVLERLVTKLRDWGALASGGESVVGPLLRLAALLGPAGIALQSLITG